MFIIESITFRDVRFRRGLRFQVISNASSMRRDDDDDDDDNNNNDDGERCN